MENKCPMLAKTQKDFFSLPIFMDLTVLGKGTLFPTKSKFLFLPPRYMALIVFFFPAAFLKCFSRMWFSSSLKYTKIALVVNTTMEVKQTKTQLPSYLWSVYSSRQCLCSQLSVSHCPRLTATRRRQGEPWDIFIFSSIPKNSQASKYSTSAN